MAESGSGSLSPERIKFITILSREEFYGKHPEYKLCQNDRNEYVYLLIDDIDNHPNCNILTDEEVRNYRNKISEQKLKEPPLTPAGLSYKQRLINGLEVEDKKRKGLFHDQNDEPIDHRKWHHKVSFLILVPSVVLIIIAYLFYQNREIYGTAQIITDKIIEKVILDGNEIMLSDEKKISGLTKGNHQLNIILKNGTNLQKNVNVFSENLVLIHLDRQNVITKAPKEKDMNGYVRFSVEGFNSYQSYVRDSLVESKKWVAIPVGSYVFRVEKKGYISEPSFRTFLISTGDSIRLPFNFRKIKVNEKIITGDIDVSANVSSADIYINGKKSGYKTNHIFSNMPAGDYTITIKKSGYKLTDSPKRIKISEQKRFVSMRFNLENDASLITIETKGQSGKIFINGKFFGEGRVTSNIGYGKHKISFEEIPNYYKPDDVLVDFNKKYAKDIVARYYPIINKSFFVNKKSSTVNVQYGYSQFNKFKADNSKKAKLIEKFGKKFFEVKYPFAYNNPVAGHAFLYQFNLNNAFINDQEVNVYLYIYYTDENFSLASSLNSRVAIIVNNRRKFHNLKVEHSFANAAEKGLYQKIKINDLLQNGKNEILIYSPKSNNSVLMFRGFEIKK